MCFIKRTVAFLVTLTLVPAGVAVAGTPGAATRLTSPKIVSTSATPILDSGRRYVAKMAVGSGRRRQATTPDPRMAAGFPVGAMIGGYAGLYVGARACHCESSKAAVAGMALGATAGLWIAYKLMRR